MLIVCERIRKNPIELYINFINPLWWPIFVLKGRLTLMEHINIRISLLSVRGAVVWVRLTNLCRALDYFDSEFIRCFLHKKYSDLSLTVELFPFPKVCLLTIKKMFEEGQEFFSENDKAESLAGLTCKGQREECRFNVANIMFWRSSRLSGDIICN